MANRERKIASIGSLLLILFTWYWCGVTLFSHQHDIDGVLVTHSHPIAGSSHTHSASQMQAISFLAMWFALAASVGFVLRKYGSFKASIIINITEQISSADVTANALRAPPACLL